MDQLPDELLCQIFDWLLDDHDDVHPPLGVGLVSHRFLQCLYPVAFHTVILRDEPDIYLFARALEECALFRSDPDRNLQPFLEPSMIKKLVIPWLRLERPMEVIDPTRALEVIIQECNKVNLLFFGAYLPDGSASDALRNMQHSSLLKPTRLALEAEVASFVYLPAVSDPSMRSVFGANLTHLELECLEEHRGPVLLPPFPRLTHVLFSVDYDYFWTLEHLKKHLSCLPKSIVVFVWILNYMYFKEDSIASSAEAQRSVMEISKPRIVIGGNENDDLTDKETSVHGGTLLFVGARNCRYHHLRIRKTESDVWEVADEMIAKRISLERQSISGTLMDIL